MRGFKQGIVAILFLTLAGSAWAAEPFARVSRQISIYASNGYAFNEIIWWWRRRRYFVAKGLELGVDGEAWTGNSPSIYKVSPQVRYVLTGNVWRPTWAPSTTELD